MKVLLIGEKYTEVIESFREEGYQVNHIEDSNILKPAEIEKQITTVLGKEPALVFTFDFFPAVARACHNNGYHYISWVWDCPHFSLWSKAARYESNTILLFDKMQYEMQKQRGLQNVYHFLLGSDVTTFEKTIEEGKNVSPKYAADVSFVGSLYSTSKDVMLDSVSYLPENIKGYIDGLVAAQYDLWGVDVIEETVTEEDLLQLKKYMQFDFGTDYEVSVQDAFIKQLIKRKVSRQERIQMCEALSKQFSFKLYTGSPLPDSLKKCACGKIDYLKELPLVYHNSKINIHSTIHDIPSGISQRVFDVLACGGFLLTNYQPEIAEYFEDGAELVMYSSIEDLCEKTAYYLAHEEERRAIAEAGCEKVKKLYSYKTQVKKIIKTYCER